MTDYKKMIAEHSCKPNQGCGVMTICMCGVAEDMADEIERLREALRLYQCQCEDGQCEVAFDNDERGELCGMPARAALGEGKE